MTIVFRLLAVIVSAMLGWPIQAQIRSDGPVLAAADLRYSLDLSGPWTWSIDPYRDGQAGFHGEEAGIGHRRYDDTDVAAARTANPLALYEYDMDRSPVAQLPGSWLSHDPQMRHYQGLVWYQRRFDAPARPGMRAFLRFGAANYRADVWLNGKRLGQHEGGFTPFAFEVTGILRSSGNRLVAGIDSQRDEGDVPPPVTDWETYGGITRPVALVWVPETFIDDGWVRLTQDGRIAADVVLYGQAKALAPVRLTIPALGVKLSGRTDANGHLAVRGPAPRALRRWSPESPVLYEVEIVAGKDRWRDRIGFRTLAVQGSHIVLNGKPIFLRGISLHEEEIGPDPVRNMTSKAARALLTEVKQGLHGNYIRLAHYPHGETMLRAADEMGLLVWSEIPVYWRVAFDDPAVLTQARRMLAEMILRDRNRASIALWSVGNETPLSEPRNAFMRRLAQDARALDPSRLISAALLSERETTPTGPVMVLSDPLAAELDVLAVNTYNGWYSGDRPSDVPQIAWRVPSDKPLLLSEFGADAKIGLRGSSKFSEEYQAEYYRGTLAMAEKIETLAGMSPWILKDFRSPRRQLPDVQDGWNRKGLISETGQRKLAFDVLADWYARQNGAR